MVRAPGQTEDQHNASVPESVSTSLLSADSANALGRVLSAEGLRTRLFSYLDRPIHSLIQFGTLSRDLSEIVAVEPAVIDLQAFLRAFKSKLTPSVAACFLKNSTYWQLLGHPNTAGAKKMIAIAQDVIQKSAVQHSSVQQSLIQQRYHASFHAGVVSPEVNRVPQHVHDAFSLFEAALQQTAGRELEGLEPALLAQMGLLVDYSGFQRVTT